MDAIPEIIFTSSTGCSAYDPENGNMIDNFKACEIAPKTLALIGEDYIIGAVANKPLLKVWTLYKSKREEVEFPCRGVITALSVSSCGTYCIAGVKEDILIWNVSSGELLTILTRHYQDITCLRFSSDDSHFLSGGKDGHVIVWILSQAIGVNIEADQVKPRFVWNHHSAEVTDIYLGELGPVSRVATTSLDMTCKLYELDSGILLSTICMDVPLTAVVMDTLEYMIFIGDIKGHIYKINTYERLPREIHCNEIEKAAYQVHDSKVTSLSVSLGGEKIISASEDKTCKVWDMKSMACILTIPHDGKVTNVFVAMKPAVMSGENLFPQFYVRHFKRDFDDHLRNPTLRKYQEPKLCSKKLSLLHENSPDQFYSSALLHGKIQTSVEERLPPVNEDLFQEAIHGESVNELRTVNNQLYTFLVNRGLDRLRCDSDSDD